MDAALRRSLPWFLFGVGFLWTWSFCLPVAGWQDERIRFSRLQDPLHQELVQLTPEQIEAIDGIANEILEFGRQFEGDERAKIKEIQRRESVAHDRCVQLLDQQQRYRDELLTMEFTLGYVDALDDMRSFEDDLQLSEEQQSFLTKLRREKTLRRFKLLEAELGGTLDRDLASSILQRDSSEHLASIKEAVESQLTTKQKIRLREMRWRQAMMLEGIEFFARPEIQEWLGFTDAEKLAVKRILDDAKQIEDKWQRFAKTHGDACKAYYRSLSPDRIARLKQLVGPPLPPGTPREHLDLLKDL